MRTMKDCIAMGADLIIKRAKSSIDVSFTARDVYTNKLYSKDTRIELDDVQGNILVVDYSHYCNWNKTKQNEPEYSDYTKAKNMLEEIEKVVVLDETIVSKINNFQPINRVRIIVSSTDSHIYEVNTVLPQTRGLLTFELKR